MNPSPTAAAAIRRGYADGRFGQVHFRSAGSDGGDAPPLVLLHQNPSSSQEFEPLIEALADGGRVIAFDTPGYGMSDPPPAPPGMAGYAAAFSDALDSLALAGPIDLYGFHTGTLLAVELAILRPDLVRRLVLTGIPMFPPEDRAARLAEARSFPPPDEAGEVIFGLLRDLWSKTVEHRHPDVPLDRALRAFSDKAKVLHRFTWAYEGVWAYDFERLALVRQPVLLLQPNEMLRRWTLEAGPLFPAASVKELPDLDRDIFERAAGRMAAEIRAFLNGTPEAGARTAMLD